MRILFCGDVVGRAGRAVVLAQLPRLRKALALDLVIVNAENAAHGFGITPSICDELFIAGCDVITTGNHAWDRREGIVHYAHEKRLLRPLNYPAAAPGRGAGVFTTRGGQQVLVANVMGRLFMDPLDDPFAAMDGALQGHRLGRTVAAIIVDVHAEATSEKMAMGHALDGRVSLVVGTHSHIPTADAQILPDGTAFQCDAGMCGDYDSVIGMRKEGSLYRFRTKMPGERMQPAEGPATLCAVFVETHPRTGLARQIAPLRLGGRLQPAWPLTTPPPAGPTRRSEAGSPRPGAGAILFCTPISSI